MTHIRGDPIANLELKVLRIQISTPFPIVPSLPPALHTPSPSSPIAIPTHLTPATNGTRRISSSTILSKTSGAIPVEAGPSHFIDIPAQFVSEAALRSVGFSDQVAASLWLRWQTRLHDLPWTLEQVVTRILRASPIDAEGPGDDWDGVMEEWGLRKSLRESVLAGEFSDIRATWTAKFWAIYSISRFWRSLEIFQQASQRRLLKSKHGVDSIRREIATITSKRWPAFH